MKFIQFRCGISSGIHRCATKKAHVNIKHYPVTSVKTNVEKGCWEMCHFSTLSDPHSHGSWDKSKNPYPLRNCIILKLATAEAPGTTMPEDSWFFGPQQLLRLDIESHPPPPEA